MQTLGIRHEAHEWFAMKIREFSIKDFAAVSQLWRRSGFEIRPGDRKEELRRKLERDSDLFLVAEEDSKIVGAVIGAWDGRRAWIYNLAARAHKVVPRFVSYHFVDSSTSFTSTATDETTVSMPTRFIPKLY